MDLSSLVSIGQKYRHLLLLGVLLGFMLLLLSLYSMHPDTKNESMLPFRLEQRNQHVYRTSVDVMIDDPGFAVGQSGNIEGRRDAFRRTVELAPTYAYMATSKMIIDKVERIIGPLHGSVSSNAIEESPVFSINVEGRSRKEAVAVANTVAATFTSYVETQQIRSGIAPANRLIVKALGEPENPVASNSMAFLKAAVAFFSPIIASFLLALALENMEREKEEIGLRDVEAISFEA